MWQELPSKPYFVPGLVTSAAIALLFALLSNRSATITMDYAGLIPVAIPIYSVVLALLIAGGGTFAVYRMAGKRKVWWLIPSVAVFTALMVRSPIMGLLQAMYGAFISEKHDNDSVLISFIKYLFEAGLPEETIKAIPVAIGAFLGWKLTAGREGSSVRQLAVFEPLDGILIGAASGYGFAFVETLFQYVPEKLLDSQQTLYGLIAALKQLNFTQWPSNLFQVSTVHAVAELYVLLAKQIGVDRASFELQQIIAGRQGDGLELMIPRLLSEVFGHAAYAGIFGYFIGLAAMKPNGRLKTVLIGLAIAATLHAMWDSMAASLLMYFLLAALAFVMLAVTILKARAISPDRSQLVASQIIDRFDRTPRHPAQAIASAARQPARPPAAAPVSITWDDDSNLRYIEIGSARVPATVGARLYERQVPGGKSPRDDGVLAEVNANPRDPGVLGLKNLTAQTWLVTTSLGQTRELAPGRSIRLEAGLTIRIGDSVAHVR
jgi:RsiW-degrading membrane proteinase PrsW (M82 family)